MTFEGKEYKVRTVYINSYGNETIGPESLQKQLFSQDGKPVSDEAKTVDKQIFFYVGDDYLRILSERDLGELVEKELAKKERRVWR